jgi:hypothetical protein
MVSSLHPRLIRKINKTLDKQCLMIWKGEDLSSLVFLLFYPCQVRSVWRIMASLAAPKPLSSFLPHPSLPWERCRRDYYHRLAGETLYIHQSERLRDTDPAGHTPIPTLFLSRASILFTCCQQWRKCFLTGLEFSGFPLQCHIVLTVICLLKQNYFRLIDNICDRYNVQSCNTTICLLKQNYFR